MTEKRKRVPRTIYAVGSRNKRTRLDVERLVVVFGPDLEIEIDFNPVRPGCIALYTPALTRMARLARAKGDTDELQVVFSGTNAIEVRPNHGRRRAFR